MEVREQRREEMAPGADVDARCYARYVTPPLMSFLRHVMLCRSMPMSRRVIRADSAIMRAHFHRHDTRRYADVDVADDDALRCVVDIAFFFDGMPQRVAAAASDGSKR